MQSFKTWTGPAGRPGPRTGPGGGKNPLGNWPDKTRSIKPGRPGIWSTLSNPSETGQFFFILAVIKRHRFGLYHSISSLHHYQQDHHYISSLVVQA